MGDGPSVPVVRVFPFTQTPEFFSTSHETRFVTADSDTKLPSDNSTGPLPFHAQHSKSLLLENLPPCSRDARFPKFTVYTSGKLTEWITDLSM